MPDGLKVKSHTITKKIKDLTGANVILWGEPTYGACDLADRPLEEVGADALIHLGHMPMPYHSEFYAIPTYFVPVIHTGKLNLKDQSLEKIRKMLPKKIGIVTTAQHLHMIDEATEKLEGIFWDINRQRLFKDITSSIDSIENPPNSVVRKLLLNFDKEAK